MNTPQPLLSRIETIRTAAFHTSETLARNSVDKEALGEAIKKHDVDGLYAVLKRQPAHFVLSTWYDYKKAIRLLEGIREALAATSPNKLESSLACAERYLH